MKKNVEDLEKNIRKHTKQQCSGWDSNSEGTMCETKP